MTKKIELYDEFADYYDLMVDWQSRLDSESAFLHSVIDTAGAKRVLDLACGTGMHSILFARWGLDVVAADPSESMLTKARANAMEAGVKVDFIQAGFGEMAVYGRDFDVVFCLGNSLPHLISAHELSDALRDVYQVLRPGGVFLTQNRNYDKVWAEKNRFMPVDAVERDGKEIIFFRLLDFHAELITFNIVTLVKQAGKWSYAVRSTKHRPVFRRDLEDILVNAGFSAPRFFGDLKGSSYDVSSSGDLVALAEKAVVGERL